jgi:hypothetical protein
MKTTVHFSVPKLPEGRFVAELVANVSGSYEGTAITSGAKKENWITIVEAQTKLREAGFPVSYKTVTRLAYSGELEHVRLLPTRVRIKESSVLAFIARVKCDPEVWRGKNPLVRLGEPRKRVK